MDHIIGRLSIGGIEDAYIASVPGITCLFNLSQFTYQSQLVVIPSYMPDECLLERSTWHRAVKRLALSLQAKHHVLVHCRLGKSRSPSVVAAYLAYCGHSETPDDALEFIKKKRPVADPHPSTWDGVLAWWKGLR